MVNVEECVLLGQRLREARKYLGLSQQSVADKVGMQRVSITMIENGQQNITTLQLKRFAALYHWQVADLLSLNESDTMIDPVFNELWGVVTLLSPHDREQVLRFAQFLRGAGKAPTIKGGNDD